MNDATLVAALLAGDRRALAKAITLVESTHPDHQARADALMTEVLPHSGNSLRLGISGAPGVGKSTFIEALGLHVIEQGHRVAVLAVDPSSSVSGGSILGDKTRMEHLVQASEAFIRPSPAGRSLGGVANHTREAMLLCEAAGFDVIVVETVGVGQSEIAVAGMVDLFTLLQLPNAGDELQGIKRGVMELADLVVINKADVDPQAAQRAAGQFEVALHLLRPPTDGWQPRVLQTSALNQSGVAEFWTQVTAFAETVRANGALTERRRSQAVDWMWNLVNEQLRHHFENHPVVKQQLPRVLDQLRDGKLLPHQATRQLLDAMQTRAH